MSRSSFGQGLPVIRALKRCAADHQSNPPHPRIAILTSVHWSKRVTVKQLHSTFNYRRAFNSNFLLWSSSVQNCTYHNFLHLCINHSIPVLDNSVVLCFQCCYFLLLMLVPQLLGVPQRGEFILYGIQSVAYSRVLRRKTFFRSGKQIRLSYCRAQYCLTFRSLASISAWYCLSTSSQLLLTFANTAFCSFKSLLYWNINRTNH